MRGLDVLLASIGLLLTAPLLVVLAILVRVTSPGPAWYRATRVGRQGRLFGLWKLRTLAPSASGPAITVAHDRRITPLGGLLRRTHLDELPQLWNVLRGEMALVGPRPEDPLFVDEGDPRWTEVLALRPGLTGPTQLRFAAIERRQLRGIDAERVYREHLLPQKLARDVEYVRNRTLAYDLKVLVRTGWSLIRSVASRRSATRTGDRIHDVA